MSETKKVIKNLEEMQQKAIELYMEKHYKSMFKAMSILRLYKSKEFDNGDEELTQLDKENIIEIVMEQLEPTYNFVAELNDNGNYIIDEARASLEK